MGSDALVHDREHTADHCLRGYYRCHYAEDEKGDVEYLRLIENHLEENIFCFRVTDKERSLAQVIQHKGDKHKKPCPGDRYATEVSHVRIKGLTAGCAQYNFGENEEACNSVFIEKLDGIIRVQRLEHRR